MEYDADMTHITSIKQLVAFFGGDTALSEELGISQSAVAQWKLRGQIATGWHLRLLAEIRRRGATVEASVFGMDEDTIAPLLRGVEGASDPFEVTVR